MAMVHLALIGQRMSFVGVRPQPVDATQALNRFRTSTNIQSCGLAAIADRNLFLWFNDGGNLATNEPDTKVKIGRGP